MDEHVAAPGTPQQTPHQSPQETPEQEPEQTAEQAAGQAGDLARLVDRWLDWKGVAGELGVSVGKVRTMIRDHQLAAVVPTPGAGPQVPADLLMDGLVVKGVSGLVTVLSDGGWDDHEILTWLFTDDPTLPGRPIDALREDRGSEVKRRAQAISL